MKRKLKRVGERVIAIILSIIIACGLVHHSGPSAIATSVMRAYDLEGVLILDEATPLSAFPEDNVCIEALNLINSYRETNGLGALLWSKDLEAAAAVRADEANVCWSHTRPNGQPWYTVNPSIMYGENLGKGYYDAGSLVQAWKDSPTHNENLLFTDFKYAAISCVNNVYALEFA